MSEDQANITSGWSLDKRIPLAMVGAILLQTMAIVIWGTHLEDRVGMLERNSVTTEQYARVDEKMSALKKDMQDIKDDIRRMAVRQKP